MTPANTAIVRTLLGLCQQYAVLVLVTCTCLGIGGIALFMTQGKLNTDLGTLIQPDDDLKWYQSNEAFKERFPMYQQTALVVIRGPDANATQAAARALKEAFTQHALVKSVFAPTIDAFIDDHRLYFLEEQQLSDWLQGTDYNFGAVYRFDEQPDAANAVIMIADMLGNQTGQPLPRSVESLIESFLAGEPKFNGFYPLHAPDQNEFVEILIVNGQQALDQALPNAAIVAALNQAIDDASLPSDINVALTGEIALAHEEIAAALTGIEIAGLISLVLLAIILGWGIGNFRIIILIFTILSIGIGTTLGFAVLTVGSFNTLSMLFVVMFFGLAVDFAVHFALRLQASQEQTPEALTQAVRDMGPALILCTATSAIAFLSFLPTAYRGMAELGLISAGGMVIALGLTLVVTPAYLQLWPISGSKTAQPKAAEPRSFDYPIWLTWMIIAAMPVALYFALKVEFNYSVLSMRDAGSPAMRALARLQTESQQTDYSISILAENSAEAQQLKSQLQRLPSVGDVRIPDDLVPTQQLEKQLKIGASAALYENLWQADPDTYVNAALHTALEYFKETLDSLNGDHHSQANAILLAASKLLESPEDLSEFNQGLALQHQRDKQALRRLLMAEPFAIADLPEDFRNRFIGAEGQQLISIQPKTALTDRKQTDQFLQEIQSVTPDIAGRSAVEWGIGEVVVEAFRSATLYALIGVMLCLWLYFRHWLTVALVLTPIASTLLFTFAMSYLLGFSINMANILVVPLIIGLGVDASIHVTHRYFHSAEHARRYIAATRRAVMISGLTTLGTFFSLIFSPHHGAASIGMLLTVAITIMLILSLFLLPSLLQFFEQRGFLTPKAV